jgi:hypothetical protein
LLGVVVGDESVRADVARMVGEVGMALIVKRKVKTLSSRILVEIVDQEDAPTSAK